MANLITIDEFKTYKGINSETDDTIISLLIGNVTSFIKEYTGRYLIDYAHTDKVEYFDGTDYPLYFPNEFPLISVTELATSTDGGVTYTALVENTDYFVDLEEDALVNNTALTGFVTSSIKHKSCRVTYKAGYTTAPHALQQAALDMVEYYRKEEHAISKSMQSAHVENPVIILNGSQLPAHIKRVLDLYRVL